MGETSAFLLLTLATAVLASACVLANKSISWAQGMARAFYIFSVGVSLAVLVYILLGELRIVPENEEYLRWLRPLLFRGWVVIGVAVSSAVLVVLNATLGMRRAAGNQAMRAFVSSPYVLQGLCFSVSLSFLCTEVGKLGHLADMRQFFLQSGYAVWFLYFIMIAETLGAIGLLIRWTQVPAALGLMVIMVGAIRTHGHDGDPFSDSLEALHLLILLGCIVVVRLLGERSEPSDVTSRKRVEVVKRS